MLFYQICFILINVILDKYARFSPFNAKYESIRILNYSIWSIGAIFALLGGDYENGFLFISNTLIFSYLYELYFHTPDKSHTIHHTIAIIGMIIGYLSGIYKFTWVQQLTLITYAALSTSILSSMRNIVELEPYKNNIKQVYYWYYIIIKITAMILHYIIIYKKRDFIQNSGEFTSYHIIALIIFLCIHITQLYFTYLITKRIKATQI